MIGGEELLTNKEKYIVVSGSTLFKHGDSFPMLMDRWRIAGGELLGLVHSFDDEMRYPGAFLW